MGVPSKEKALMLAAAGLGIVVMTSAAFASEPDAPEEQAKPAISEALPKTLPMFDIEELRVSLMQREVQVKKMEQLVAAAELPPEPINSVKIEPTPEQVLEAKYRGREEILEPLELRELLELTGFEGDSLRTAWAIAMRESRGKPVAYNGNRNTGDSSYGLFQINMLGYLGRHRAELYGLEHYDELLDPVTNAAVAFQMTEEGTQFGPWCIGPNAYNGCRVGDYPYWLTQFPEDEDANG
ncbi:MAG: transglycosylase SLT domain-containing protein [Aquiluna sp.]